MKREAFEAMMEEALQALADDTVTPSVSKSSAKGAGLKSIRYGESEQRVGRAISQLASASHHRSSKSLPMLSPAMVPPCF